MTAEPSNVRADAPAREARGVPMSDQTEREERLATYGDALMADYPTVNAKVRAVIALADQEQAELRREVERWYMSWHDTRDALDEARSALTRTEAERDEALVSLASQDTYTEEGGRIVVGQLREQRARADTAEARVRELEAAALQLRDDYQGEVEKVARVEALADEWTESDHRDMRRAAGHVRAALRGGS